MHLNVLENDNKKIEVEPVADFVAKYPISVYTQVAQMMDKVTNNKAALQMFATHLELTKSRDRFTTPLQKL